MSPEQQALYAAVVASPDDDLPRLVYADWLEENGQPERAEFIRVQCRLTKASPADADYFDLREREIELTAILSDQLEKERPKLPAGFDWEEEERGFLYRVTYNGTPRLLDWIEKHIEQLAVLVPIRGIWTASGLAENLSEFVRRSAFGRFEHLFVDSDDDLDLDDLVRALAVSRHLGRLRDLQFPFIEFSDKPFATFAAAKSLRKLTRLDSGWEGLTRRSNAALRAATWRESLQELQLFGTKFPVVASGVVFPQLHSLLLFDADLSPATVDCLNDVENFPRLAEVTLFGDVYQQPKTRKATKPLTRPLTALTLRHIDLGRNGVRRLLETPTAEGLRLLDLDEVRADAGWPTDLARVSLPSLRVLKVSSDELTGDALHALAQSPVWNTLAEVELVPNKSGVTAKEWEAFFRELNAPHLRRLSIRRTKLQERGLRGLLENTSLPALRNLQLRDCGVNEKAVRQLFTAPSLQRLVLLDLYDNRLGVAPEVLTDPGVLPHARFIDLGNVKLPPAVMRKIRQRPEVKIKK